MTPFVKDIHGDHAHLYQLYTWMRTQEKRHKSRLPVTCQYSCQVGGGQKPVFLFVFLFSPFHMKLFVLNVTELFTTDITKVLRISMDYLMLQQI